MFPAPKARAGEDRNASTTTADRQKPKDGIEDGITNSHKRREKYEIFDQTEEWNVNSVKS